MEKYKIKGYINIFAVAMIWVMVIIILCLQNVTKESEIVKKVLPNDYNIDNNYYWVSGDAPWLSIVFDNITPCDKVKLFFDEAQVYDVPVHVFYSTGDGLSEECSVWSVLKQGSCETVVDLPNGAYTELRIDIKGNFVFDHIEIEQYGKYDLLLKLLTILVGIMGLVCSLKLVEQNNKAREWIHNNIKSIIFYIIIETIIISYSTNVWLEIDNKTMSSYHLETSYHTEELKASGNKYYYNMDVSDSQLIEFEFMADILSGGGDANWNLYKNENCLLSGVLQGNDYSENKYKVQFGKSIEVDSDVIYRIGIEPINDTSLRVYADDNNYLNATYYYFFTYGNILKLLLIIFVIAISLVIGLLLSKVNLYVKYWIIAISMGILSIIIIAPCSTADEFRHFARAYSLSNGEFVTNYDEEGNPYTEIPENLYNFRYMSSENSTKVEDETNFTINLSKWLYYLKFKDTEKTVHAWIGGTDGKGIIEYLPQVIAIWIGKLLDINQVWLFYLARIGNWIIVAIIWFIIIRILPRYKMLFIVLYCIPTNFIYSCTSSTDGLLNASIMLTLAIAIKAYNDEMELKDRRILIPITIIAIYISIIKFPYVLVIFSLVVLNKNIIDVKRNAKNILNDFILITGICIIGYCMHSFLAGVTQMNAIVNVDTGGVNVHIKYAMEHALKVGQLFIQTFVSKFKGYYCHALDSFSTDIMILPYSVLILYTIVCEKNKKEISAAQTEILFFICFAIWSSVILAAYFWSAVGATELWGIQGRYMCPVIMVAAVILNLRKENNIREVEPKYSLALCTSIMFIGFTKIFQMQWL